MLWNVTFSNLNLNIKFEYSKFNIIFTACCFNFLETKSMYLHTCENKWKITQVTLFIVICLQRVQTLYVSAISESGIKCNDIIFIYCLQFYICIKKKMPK